MPPPTVFPSPAAFLQGMLSAAPCHNFCGTIPCLTLASATLETELFPEPALRFYGLLNLGELDPAGCPEHAALQQAWYSPSRGGPQGDYREGMQAKLANVIAALQAFPLSKRAVLTVPNRSIDHSCDEDAKCLRELHFWLDAGPGGDGRLHCSGFMRAQACSIYPKNIYFIALLLQRVASALGKEVGSYTHFITALSTGRE
jgi:hypothetical protein